VGLRAQEAEADDEDVAAGAAGAEVRTGGDAADDAGARDDGLHPQARCRRCSSTHKLPCYVGCCELGDPAQHAVQAPTLPVPRLAVQGMCQSQALFSSGVHMPQAK